MNAQERLTAALDLDAFGQWLESLPDDCAVGYCANPGTCPLATYLNREISPYLPNGVGVTQANVVYISISDDLTEVFERTVVALPLPFHLFVRAVDGDVHVDTAGVVTAGRAKRHLATVREALADGTDQSP